MGNQYAYMFMLRCYNIDENRHMKEKKSEIFILIVYFQH